MTISTGSSRQNELFEDDGRRRRCDLDVGSEVTTEVPFGPGVAVVVVLSEAGVGAEPDEAASGESVNAPEQRRASP